MKLERFTKLSKLENAGRKPMPTRFNDKKNKKFTLLVDERRSYLDRRTGEDRRKAYNLDYFLSGGKERRKSKERRMRGERRSDWKLVDKWYSVFVGNKKR